MALLSDVRSALAAAVATVPGLRASGSATGQVSPPAAVVLPAPGTFISYSETFELNVADFALEIILLVSSADDRDAQLLLDGYLAATGPSSVRAAIGADPTLGHVVDWATVETASGYGMLSWAGTDYLGARLQVTLGTE